MHPSKAVNKFLYYFFDIKIDKQFEFDNIEKYLDSLCTNDIELVQQFIKTLKYKLQTKTFKYFFQKNYNANAHIENVNYYTNYLKQYTILTKLIQTKNANSYGVDIRMVNKIFLKV